MQRVLAPVSSILINGVHRFATCWQITRTDSVVLYLTNHNTKLVVDGHTFDPVGSPSTSAIERKDGVGGNNFNAKSYLHSDAITHDDLRAGRYRGAEIVEFVVDWKYPWLGKMRVSICRILETAFTGEVWEAQIEDLKSRMKQRVGRVYSRNCDYVFGDPDTCGFDLSTVEQSDAVGSVTDPEQKRIFTLDTLSVADGYFDDGTILWTDGNNKNLYSEIKTQLGSVVELHVATPFKIVASDPFNIWPGCKHTKEACKTFQGNLQRFGGFPTIPGNDKLFQSPNAH